MLLGSTTSCAALWGFEDGSLGPDAAVASDAGPDVASPSGALPPIPVNLPIPPACESRHADLDALFVDVEASGDSESCSALAPCKSIQRALSQVGPARHVVYVARGHYEENLRIPNALLGAGLRLEGRWEHRGAEWQSDCAVEAGLQIVSQNELGLDVGDDAEPLPSPADAGDAAAPVVDAATPLALELAYVSLWGRPPSAGGTSSFAIFARSAHVVVIGSQIVADVGANGSSPGEGDRPLPTTATTTCPDEIDGSGAAGLSGTALGRGDFTRAGFVLATVPDRAAGPGRQGSCGACSQSGNGGAPGVDGSGGGASVAIYLWSSQLELREGTTLTARGGGVGGNGGPGGLGASGTCTGDAAQGGTGGTGSPGAGGPAARIVQAGPNGASLAASSDACTVPATGAAGGFGGPGIRAESGAVGVLD